MTRINVIPPQDLIDKHLGSEYYEMPRIVALTRHKQNKGQIPADLDIPLHYVLGPGHMMFFVDKLTFICNRFDSIVAECQRRGRKTNVTKLKIEGLHKHWFNDYRPTASAIELNRLRIRKRLRNL